MHMELFLQTELLVLILLIVLSKIKVITRKYGLKKICINTSTSFYWYCAANFVTNFTNM